MALTVKAEVFVSGSQMPSFRNRNQRRNRPFLSQACQKTKLCKYYDQGTCGRGDECAFAHGSEQLSGRPDLQRTKMCPRMETTGTCTRGDACKFAHSVSELRCLLPSWRSILPPAWPQDDVRMVTALNVAAAAGALSIGETIMHLENIFEVMHDVDAQSTPSEMRLTAKEFAAKTVADTWASLGLSRSDCLPFEVFYAHSHVFGSSLKEIDDEAKSYKSTVYGTECGDDTATSSACGTPSPLESPRSDVWQDTCQERSPSLFSSTWDAPSLRESICVRNTFIELKSSDDQHASTPRRARSLSPSR